MQRQTPSSLLLVAAIAGGVGFVAFVALMLVGGFNVSPAVFLAIVLAVAVAAFLFIGFHKGPSQDHPNLSPAKDGQLGDRTRKAGTAGVEPGTAGVAPGSVTQGQPVAGRNTTTAAQSAGAASTAHNAPTGSGAADSPTGDDSGSIDPSQVGGRAEPVEDRAETSSGQDRPLNTSDDRSDRTTTEADATGTTDGADATDPTNSADTKAEPMTEADAQDSADGAPKWKSTQVSGTQELADRKGEWKYDRATAATGAGAGGAAAASEANATVGQEPARLDAPRDGGPDDLKRIKGIGPKLEDMLHGMGFYHFDQIANWTDEELTWVDSRLDGFNGRASRDAWVSQAKVLAEGSETNDAST